MESVLKGGLAEASIIASTSPDAGGVETGPDLVEAIKVTGLSDIQFLRSHGCPRIQTHRRGFRKSITAAQGTLCGTAALGCDPSAKLNAWMKDVIMWVRYRSIDEWPIKGHSSITAGGRLCHKNCVNFQTGGFLILMARARIPSEMAPRKTVKITAWPDPLVQERLEDMGFFFDAQFRTWIRFCDEGEIASLADWLKRHRLAHEVVSARGRGELKKHPKLSEQLILKNGGSHDSCALCGASHAACRQWIEGDDTDAIDYPNPARFFLCGNCVQTRMQPHPRLYVPASEQL